MYAQLVIYQSSYVMLLLVNYNMIYLDKKYRQTTVIINKRQSWRRTGRYEELQIQHESPSSSARQIRKRKRQPILHQDKNGNHKLLNHKDTHW